MFRGGKSTLLAELAQRGLDAAIAEYERLSHVYPSLGYDVITLPKIAVGERADFIMRILSGSSADTHELIR